MTWFSGIKRTNAGLPLFSRFCFVKLNRQPENFHTMLVPSSFEIGKCILKINTRSPPGQVPAQAPDYKHRNGYLRKCSRINNNAETANCCNQLNPRRSGRSVSRFVPGWIGGSKNNAPDIECCIAVKLKYTCN